MGTGCTRRLGTGTARAPVPVPADSLCQSTRTRKQVVVLYPQTGSVCGYRVLCGRPANVMKLNGFAYFENIPSSKVGSSRGGNHLARISGRLRDPTARQSARNDRALRPPHRRPVRRLFPSADENPFRELSTTALRPRELMPGLRATYEWPQLGSEHPVGTPALVPICLAGSAAPAGGTSVLS